MKPVRLGAHELGAIVVAVGGGVRGWL